MRKVIKKAARWLVLFAMRMLGKPGPVPRWAEPDWVVEWRRSPEGMMQPRSSFLKWLLTAPGKPPRGQSPSKSG